MRLRTCLGIAAAVTPALVTDLLMQMDSAPAEPASSDVISSVPMSAELLSVAVRLVESLHHSERARVLGPDIVCELVYLLLSGPGGNGLRSLAVGDNRLGRIAKVIQRLQTEYAVDHDMTALARDAA